MKQVLLDGPYSVYRLWRDRASLSHTAAFFMYRAEQGTECDVRIYMYEQIICVFEFYVLHVHFQYRGVTDPQAPCEDIHTRR